MVFCRKCKKTKLPSIPRLVTPIGCKEECRRAREQLGTPCDDCYTCYTKMAGEITTLDEMFSLVVASIKGEVPLWSQANDRERCVFSNLPVDNSSADIRSINEGTQYFVRMNQLDFLTIDSQMGILEYKRPWDDYMETFLRGVSLGHVGKKTYEWFEKEMSYVKKSNLYHTTIPSTAERCYVTGYLSKSKQKGVFRSLKKKGFWVFVIHSNSKLNLNKVKKKKQTNIHLIDVKSKNVVKDPDIIGVTWEFGNLYTAFDSYSDSDDLIKEIFPGVFQKIKDEYVEVVMIDPMIGRNGVDRDGLFTAILSEL